MTSNLKPDFKTASEMSYANSKDTKEKANSLIKNLKEHLKQINQEESLFFNKEETIYIPDIHGDFVHLMLTLHRHGVIDKNLNLIKEHDYVFLGDFYDRAPDSDVIDLWLNLQIKNDLKIYRLIGNHEMAFFERDPNGYPVIFPSQDSIKDIQNDFQITENILKNIAEGNILATYVEKNVMYVHSYIINEDFIELGLEPNTDIEIFSHKLNDRLKIHGEYAYHLFLEHKKDGRFDWKAIMKSFNDDPLFNIYKKRNEISTSFIWRRTGVPTLKTFPVEIEGDIPENIYQIVGHTPIFSFNLPQAQPIHIPFVIQAVKGTGKVQFSDAGIGYYYKSDFERPEVVINKKLVISI